MEVEKVDIKMTFIRSVLEHKESEVFSNHRKYKQFNSIKCLARKQSNLRKMSPSFRLIFLNVTSSR